MRKNLWDDWNIVDKIGEGRYGEVYRAIKNVDGVTLSCAIKYVSLPKNQEELNELIKSGVVKNVDEANKYYLNVIEKLKQEINIMKKFNNNPNIINCFDYIQERKFDGTGVDFYIRMELAEDIDSYFKNRNPSENDVIKLGIDICSALEMCASNSIIHKDIKPANIYYGNDGNYKLGDFGIANMLGATDSHGFGTYNYMSPEVYNKKNIGFSTDLYSLGLVMYKLLNGNKLPFSSAFSNDKSILEARMSGLSVPVIKKVSKELMDIIVKACSYEVFSRYKNAGEMKKDLLKIYDKSSVNVRVNKKSTEKTLSIYEAESMLNGSTKTHISVDSNKNLSTKSSSIANKGSFDIKEKFSNIVNKVSSNNNVNDTQKKINKNNLFDMFMTIKNKLIVVVIVIIIIILLLLYGCSSKKCDAGFINKNGSCVKGYYYCDEGYTLNSDNKCQKAIESIAAKETLSCDDNYILNGTTCVLNDTKEPKEAYQCASGFTLKGTKCVREEQAAPNPSYSCPSGYTLVGTTCAKVSTRTADVKYSCSKGTLSGTKCNYTENSSAYLKEEKTCSRGTYNSTLDKCCLYYYSCYIQPTVTKTCTYGTYSNGTCIVQRSVDATKKYICPSGYEVVANQCVKTEQVKPNVKLTCASGLTLRNNVCYATVSVDAVKGYTCDSGYIFNGVSCMANNKKDAVKKYSCSRKYTLNGDKCEKYDTVNANVHYEE